jgi:uncharacterized protein (TIGR00730 family)
MLMPKSVCVYCGASVRVAEVYKETARAIGHLMAENGIAIVYGGGRVGLMGLLADAAIEAGGRVIGVIPEHLKALEVDHHGLSELHVVDSMHTRKRLMVDLSDAFIALPGGMGTLDETFEVLTWKQLRLHDKPVVVVDTDGFWQPLLGLVDHLIDKGFCQSGHRKLFTVVREAGEVLDALRAEPQPQLAVESKWL